MQKTLVYRILQIASAVALYSATSIWASTNHVVIVSNTITSINSLLVILAIAIGLPYLCFKALSKIYTPPASGFRNESTLDNEAELNYVEIKVISIDENVEKMQYRGTRYKADDLDVKQVNVSNKNSNAVKPVIKYRGTSMDSSNSVNTSVSQQTGSLLADQQIQEPAKPKERMKYRGSYIE
jgi:hypothetical protein